MPTACRYQPNGGYVDDVAVIEAARAVGLADIPIECRCPENSTSRGVGALILSALSHGAKKLLLTVGGTACNDGGAGMLCELGARFYDHATELFDIRASDLCRITKIDICGIDKRLYDLDIDIACDVTNPLLGCDGATYTYGKQKGASDAALARLEYGIKNFAEKLAPNAVDTPGVGAGGGIPFPLVALFGAHIDSGIATVLKATRFESELQLADLVITGEGMVDAQSACGKAVGGVAVLASQLDIPVIVIAGSVGPGAETMFSLGVFDIYAIRDISPTTEYSIEHAAFLLRQVAAALDFDVYLNL